MSFIDKVKKIKSVAEPEPTPLRSQYERKIEDVLEVLQIPPTFEIPNDIFLPEDLKRVEFDQQVPHGYDEGQVMSFAAQSRNSVKFFVELLRERNEHVAKLASVIDKLQVDAHNARFENEAMKGSTLMDTGDGEDALLEAQLRIRNLEDQIRDMGNQTGLPTPPSEAGVPRATFDRLNDRYTLAQAHISTLEEKLFNLRVGSPEDIPAFDAKGQLPDAAAPAAPAPRSLPTLPELPPRPARPEPISKPAPQEPSLPQEFPEFDGFIDDTPIPQGERRFSVYDDDEAEKSLDDLMRNLND